MLFGAITVKKRSGRIHALLYTSCLFSLTHKAHGPLYSMFVFRWLIQGVNYVLKYYFSLLLAYHLSCEHVYRQYAHR